VCFYIRRAASAARAPTPTPPAALAGWDLVTRLMTQRNNLNRGRLSVGEALRHRYFLLPDL
jgi:hypothetical protein